MKNYILPLFLYTSIFSQKKEDIESIKSMCGCYQVEFNFAETFNYPKDTINYKASKIKQETALEWIQLIEDTPKKISLQHLLIIGKENIVKHWRQDWLFENINFYHFNGSNDWNFLTKTNKEVKQQWTQSVFGVEDMPRYTGSGSWVHIDQKHYWENTTNAPLPRREYTQRNDYNITRRTNRQEITKNGWIHNQDNDKIIKDKKGNEYLLAQEKGYNIYTKIEDSKCLAAQNWWKENKDFWEKVRIKWNKEFAKNKYLKLKKSINGKPLFLHLYSLNITASQEEIDNIIDKFIII